MARPRKNFHSEDLLEQIHYYYINQKERVVYVHSELEAEEAGVDFRMASTLIKNLDYLSSVSQDPITLKLGTYGGCWNYGMMMYDAIKSCPCHVTSLSYAHSRSMSSIIPQAADLRLISKHCDFMIHYGSYYDEGDLRKVVNGIEHYKKANKIMFEIYADGCINGLFFKERNMDRAQIVDFLTEKVEKYTDWWLTAEEAVYYGFMDEVV